MTRSLAALKRHFRPVMATAFALLVCTSPASAEELPDPLVEARAMQAAIWGMPVVNYDLMLQEMLRVTKAKPNEVLYWSKPANWQNQTLTPNPDSIYFMSFWNLKDGPMVIDVPPAKGGSFAGNIVNVWQMPLEDAGPEGADKGAGGKYLLLPPGYAGAVPEGYIVLRSDTYQGFALLRSNLTGHSDADIATSVAYGKQLNVYPLSAAAHPPKVAFSDAYGTLFDSTIRYDARYFEHLNRIVQFEPWLERDRAMIDVLRTLGIEKGKAFTPDEKTKTLLASGIRKAHAFLAATYEAGFPVMTPGSRWFPAATAELARFIAAGYALPDAYPVDIRGVIYSLGFSGIKRLGTAQFYMMSHTDKTGQFFDGAKTYTLTVPANAPVKQYWSVTAYDRKTHALIRNTVQVSRASISQGLQKNADGTVTLHIGPKAPAGKQGNWIETNPARPFELMFRLYGPEQAFFDKQWILPDVEPVQ